VFDCVGATVWDESLASLKPGGRLVITGTTAGSQVPFNLAVLQGRPLTLMGSGARSRRSFAAMMHVAHYGGLHGVVGRTFDLADTAKAHEVMAGRDFFGKLVLRVP
jgi:NADPH:quinone reductase-like Zn-dependent oxidoreductase